MPQLSEKQKKQKGLVLIILGFLILAAVWVARRQNPVGTETTDSPNQGSEVVQDNGEESKPLLHDQNKKVKLTDEPAKSTQRAEHSGSIANPVKQPNEPNEPNPKEDTLNRTGPKTDVETQSETDHNENPEEPTRAITRDEILEVVEEMKPDVRVCYESLLKTFPEASGKVGVKFEIVVQQDSDEGRVELAELAQGATLFDDQLHDCLLEKFADLRFEAKEGPAKVVVNFPFNFTVNEPEDVD